MSSKNPDFSFLDQILAEVGYALRTSFAPQPQSARPSPAGDIADTPLSEPERALSEGLMRINHTGEIAAQALYRGQAAVAQNTAQKAQLLKAANEEQDHLLWCQQRIQELDGHVSRLAPAWYAGSFLIGVSAGLAGDRWSLGFVEETENQVSEHLDNHLQRLPTQDQRSRAIVKQMREEEAQHAEEARVAGAKPLPPAIKSLMAHTANLMRFVSVRV